MFRFDGDPAMYCAHVTGHAIILDLYPPRARLDVSFFFFFFLSSIDHVHAFPCHGSVVVAMMADRRIDTCSLAYQPTASSIFVSEQTSHQQPANNIFSLSTSHQPPANEETECAGGHHTHSVASLSGCARGT
jgi:hypothetical protein